MWETKLLFSDPYSGTPCIKNIALQKTIDWLKIEVKMQVKGYLMPPFGPYVYWPTLHMVRSTFCMVQASFCVVWPVFWAMSLKFCMSNTYFLSVLGFSKGKMHFFPKVLKNWSSCQKTDNHFLGGGGGSDPKVIKITLFFIYF